MRVVADIIEDEGERMPPHSKFYIWDDKLFEPAYYRGKRCNTYKAITDTYRIGEIMNRKKQSEHIPTVSSICGKKLKSKVVHHKSKDTARFEILDL